MPADPSSIADPRFILLAWAAGLALVAGYVSTLRITGPGFSWVAGGSSGLVALAGVLAPGATWARVGLILVAAGALGAARLGRAGVLMVAGGLAFGVEASLIGGWIPAVTATLALGGVTGEMLLGHWYLVDPRLPRWALRALAIAGIAGLAADGLVLSGLGDMPGGGGSAAFWVLLASSGLLMAGVLGALRQPTYAGVMAATGLSYLAVLTTLGAVFLGRALVAGLGPFTS